MSGSNKRQRAPNYTGDEKIRLLNIIFKYKAIVENKTTDAVTWREKEEAWIKITDEFNASCITKRSVDSVKGFFDNQKRTCHKKAAGDKKVICGTGGGPPANGNYDPIFDLTMSILNKKTVFGLVAPFGGDATLPYQPSTPSPPLLSPSSSRQNEQPWPLDSSSSPGYGNDTGVEFPEEDALATSNLTPSLTPVHDDHNYTDDVNAINWRKHSAKDLQKPVHKKLAATKILKSKPKLTSPSAESTNWINRRRPAMSATMTVSREYEELAKMKKEVTESQLRICKKAEVFHTHIQKLEIEEREIKRNREEELFKIDMAIKQAQLKHLERLSS